jgi:anti-sigma B factor antagonist
MARRLKIAERRVGDVTILDLQGRLVLDDGDTSCVEHIDGLVGQGRIRIILNLRDVTYIDSAGVGALIAKYVSLRRRGGDLRLLSLSDRVRRVITIAHLLEVFDTFESEDLAVRSFSVLHHTAL